MRRLGPRELEILQAVAEGETTAEIAARFGTSPWTVRDQRAKINVKLGARSAAHAVAIGYDRGILGDRPDRTPQKPVQVGKFFKELDNLAALRGVDREVVYREAMLAASLRLDREVSSIKDLTLYSETSDAIDWVMAEQSAAKRAKTDAAAAVSA